VVSFSEYPAQAENEASLFLLLVFTALFQIVCSSEPAIKPLREALLNVIPTSALVL
jgi:hypothetical protein